MRIAFRTGGTVGMATVGLGLLGASIVVLLYKGEAPKVLEGFGFGAALLAMFMRVGGGIFTKAADVGADLVGKVEAGIPEDDPRNAGHHRRQRRRQRRRLRRHGGRPLRVVCRHPRRRAHPRPWRSASAGLVFPLIVPAIGAITAIIGVFITKVKGNENGLTAINRGFYISAVISAVLSLIAAFVYLPQSTRLRHSREMQIDGLRTRATIGRFIGIILAGIILWLTGYFTGTTSRPTNDVARTSLTGPPPSSSRASVWVSSRRSTPQLIIGAAVYGAFLLGAGSTLLALFLHRPRRVWAA
jgi:K(+)-stimulated pyrophosphate-energized sodium pump